MFYEVDDAAAVLECYREFIAETPEQLGCFFRLAHWYRSSPRTALEISSARWSPAGTAHTRRPTRQLRPLRDVAEVEVEQVRGHTVPGPQPSLRQPPEGHAALLKGRFVTELTDEAIPAHITVPEADSARELVHASQSVYTVWLSVSAPARPPSDTGTRTSPWSIVGIWSVGVGPDTHNLQGEVLVPVSEGGLAGADTLSRAVDWIEMHGRAHVRSPLPVRDVSRDCLVGELGDEVCLPVVLHALRDEIVEGAVEGRERYDPDLLRFHFGHVA